MARSDDQTTQRSGDILGLGDVVAGETPTPRDADDVRKRRERMQEGADDLTPTRTDETRGAGATGIDMGSGGEGTDIE